MGDGGSIRIYSINGWGEESSESWSLDDIRSSELYKDLCYLFGDEEVE